MIPFNRPYIAQTAQQQLEKALQSGHHSGNGPTSLIAESLLNKLTPGHSNLLTPSCSHALEVSIRALGIGEGDEVIVPSFTFTSTANAVLLSGATPVLVDIDENTQCIDLIKVDEAITSKTRGIIVVHYAGISPNMNLLQQICAKNELYLIEDNAHGLGGSYKGRPLGTFGDISCHSFHETKNIQTGEGGSIATANSKLLSFIEVLREKGTNRSHFFRGQVDKYTWQSIGSSWIQSDILASLLVSQLEEFSFIQSARQHIWNSYDIELKSWAEHNNVRLPTVPEDSIQPAHLFYLIMPSLETRTKFISHMKSNGVMTPFHYQSLHNSPAGEQYCKTSGSFTNSIRASNCLVRLPIWASLSKSELNHILESVIEFKVS
jgi:dTDP-4-amino-4,6-dideoxygalactose transaminase